MYRIYVSRENTPITTNTKLIKFSVSIFDDYNCNIQTDRVFS